MCSGPLGVDVEVLREEGPKPGRVKVGAGPHDACCPDIN
jgi:hypothetical protein